MKTTKRFRTAGISVLAAAALLLTGCGASDTPGTTAPEGDDSGLEQTSLTFSYSASVQQLEKVPIHMALDNLADVGITSMEETFHQGGEDSVQAVARGESDFGVANAPTVFAAIKKGAPIQAIATAYMPAYLVVAPSEVEDVCGLDGKRVGIHAQISATTLYTNMALQQCPTADPEIMIVPGSAARVQAMMAGQLDASAVQFSDWLAMQEQAPGKFNVIFDVAQADLGIIDSVIFTSTATMEQKPNFVRAFIGTLQDTYASVYDNESELAKVIEEIVPDTTAEAAAELAKVSLEDKLWPADGAFDKTTLETTLKALEDSGLLTDETLPTIDECCTSEFLK
ncbi:ABC transporter substrate-binding protein [Microbacterium sp. YY-01]|uniref:ABC transporter substrate-binding protein n=1 Tax=Microbacterium sp. YY-01 TaxID=3421634 RepID=UPI003D169B93